MREPERSDDYLVNEEAIARVASLVSALALAILEILGSRPVRDHRLERTEHQQQYDELLMPHLYPEQDPRQSTFDF